MSLASDARGIARQALRSVRPAEGVRRTLRVRTGGIWVGDARWCPAEPGSVRIVALGKAAGPLLDAASQALGRFRGEAVAAVGQGYPRPSSRARVFVGDHPVPGRGSLRAGRGLLDFVRKGEPGAPVLFLISGGGSAIAEVPAEGVTLPELQATTRALLASGAPIGATNAIRRHLSALKGGGLARAAGLRPRATLALSDVVGDAPWEIASGPSVPDPTTFRDAVAAVRRYRLSARIPLRVLRALQEGAAGHRPETWKPPDDPPTLHGFHLIGSNGHARMAAARAARRRGYSAIIVPGNIVGESAGVGRRLAHELRAFSRRTRRPFAMISGGETTVSLGRWAGIGGRNEEMALAAIPVLDRTEGVGFLTVATDGVDGPTDAAGGWADGRLAAEARRRGVDLAKALRTHASDAALERLGARFVTGPTGTNVADLQIRLGRRTGSTPRPGAASSSRGRRSSSAGSR